ncbi:hypothetical protein M427DRAFT_130222 [Gonapodya prolifera JEL478]|uniref:RNA ligase domain-containing protein n=1 Tax=Gonapodya prolifera (strain JEL478) TaxID=1344416 RepID=A0A139B0R5_GONPJ|nr:hypothetical protein M427DRAFT_130222 [Gonapodya prolifera JEL478]|eukprot:KXS22569.1 hypothetical protein M427DRAFT_130222 [Gonapodya prolifera JEL478]
MAPVLASLETVGAIEHHSNADSLDLATVLGYTCIVKRDLFSVGDLVVLIQPDTVLPDAPWAATYRAKYNRVKAVRLRNEWSFGIVESVAILGDYAGPRDVGTDVTEVLGVTKYDPPQLDDGTGQRFVTGIRGDVVGRVGLPFNIPKTDEERWQSLPAKRIPIGLPVDITLKIDGQSWTAYVKLLENGEVACGITGRNVEFDLATADNAYTQLDRAYGVLDKLKAYVLKTGKSIALRGESYGGQIQKAKHNPHSSLPRGLALFGVYLIDEKRYAHKGDPFYFVEVARELGLPAVPIVEKDVLLTREHIKLYDEGLDKINGKPFEGVVVKHAKGSFKIINKSYDSKK